ncbi:methyl-accepting chemotaxis protein [Methanogenium organophilum]|uniref:Methyl-accepting chemotaxis protein n=1 Tax=Methanogenium organophilum TaxID=2199 RepID=A0A9X9T8I3_METOG|nr:methyl-accepting chemotaxis protein [Methanogenium organophilum]WAI02498.1 methyl-accepting chemotaxis protein [Methanogenium organophilum]
MSLQLIEDALRRALEGDFTASLDQAAADPEMQELAGLVDNAIGKMKKSVEYQEMLRGVDEFIANYPYPLAIYGADGACLMLNDHYCTLFRDSCDALMKKSFSDFDITILGGDSLFASHDTKKNSETELMVAWDDGSENYLKLFQVPISDGEGDISVVYHIYFDQTEIVKEQKELHKLQKRADAFLLENPQGITMLAADKHRLDLNEEYQRIWRGGYDELMAKKLYDFNINIVGGDDFYASYETKKKAITDMEIDWDNGEKSYLRLFQTPILDDDGEIDVNYYIYQDLTEHHEEMEEIKTLQRRADAFLQQNPQGITVLAADKHRLDLNKEYERIWRGGYEELMAKKLYDFNINIVGGDDFYASYETKRKAITDMEISWENGENSYLRLFQTPILDENGEIDVNYYIYQDLTPERTLSQFLDEEIERQEANLDRLARGDSRGLDLTVGVTNQYTAEAGALFEDMNHHLVAVQKSIKEMVDDFVATMHAMQGGDSTARAHPDQFEGFYMVLMKGLNDILDTIFSPVNESYRVVKAYADKDFSRRFSASMDVKGDFLKLKTAIDNVGVNMGNALSDVKIAVDNVDANMADASRGVEEIAKAMEDVAVSSQQSSEAFRRQLEAVEVVAREISDLSASIEEIASTSQEVKEQADHVSRMGNEASTLGREANDKMNAVEKIAEESVTQIEQLNQKMAEISKIVKLINDISSQTNLLALNAAIEAARAGEHGRGFAVVAGEVRNLAAESKAATDSIEELIEGIQRDSNTTAASMKSAYAEIESSLESVHQAITSLNGIVSGAHEASEGIREIARATDDQANATNRVMEKMEETTTLTKENMSRIDDVAAVTEEVAASTEEVGSGTYEVTRMTEKLRAMVEVFRTE